MARSLALLAVVALALSMAGAANADTKVHPGHGLFYASGAENQPPSPDGTATQPGASQPDAAPIKVNYSPCMANDCAIGHCPGGTTPMWTTLFAANGTQAGSPTISCLGQPAVVTAAQVASAFRRIPVPTPALHIQPVHGRTLVNFKTNFYATSGQAFIRTVHLLGQAVTLRIHVSSYDFSFGDGQHLSTTTPGAAYPNLTNTHQYRSKGTVHPTLTTTWSADYRINNGAWHTVNGTVTKQTPPQNLEVTTARPVLVNPSGPPR